MSGGRKLVGVIRKGKRESENSDVTEAKEGKNIKNGSRESRADFILSNLAKNEEGGPY